MNETEVYVAVRREMEIIPQGPSCTETEKSYYLRLRSGSVHYTIRFTKDPFRLVSVDRSDSAL